MSVQFCRSFLLEFFGLLNRRKILENFRLNTVTANCTTQPVNFTRANSDRPKIQMSAFFENILSLICIFY